MIASLATTKDAVPNKLLTTQEVAQLLGLSAGTLNNWRAAGRGPRFIKLNNGVIRYQASDVAKYISRNTVEPARRAS